MKLQRKFKCTRENNISQNVKTIEYKPSEVYSSKENYVETDYRDELGGWTTTYDKVTTFMIAMKRNCSSLEWHMRMFKSWRNSSK